MGLSLGALTWGQDSGWKLSESRFGPLLKKLGSDEKKSRQVLAKSCPTLVLKVPSPGSTFNSMVNSSKVSLCPKLPQNKFCQWVFWGKVDGFFKIHIIFPFRGLGFSLYSCVNSNPLQLPCPKNLKDRGAWGASP